MRPRSTWKGYLKLSLVSCSVALFNASSTAEKISFRQIHKKTGNRIRHQLVDEATKEPVDRTDIVKGYEVSKDSYLLMEEDDFEQIRLETSQVIDIEEFVPAAEVDPIFLDEPYYLAPADKISAEPFVVIREAMAQKQLVGIARVVMSRRERIMMLTPRGKGILAQAIRYPYEVRQDTDYFSDIPEVDIPDEMMSLATHILEKKSARFDPAKFVDRYEDALVDMIKAKQLGQPLVTPQVSPPFTVVDLMEALRRSVQGEKPKAPAKKAPAKAKTTGTGTAGKKKAARS